MADDTPTLEQARQALIDLLISPNDPAVVPRIDALIAAVRAETSEEITFQLLNGRPSPELLTRLKRESS